METSETLQTSSLCRSSPFILPKHRYSRSGRRKNASSGTKRRHSRCSKDLADSLFDLSNFEFKPSLCVYSLRSLRISTDHPFELFTLLFKIAPFLQYIQLIQTYDSSLKWKSNTQLYECINFVIYQCQERLKCLRHLHVQLRSVSDQVRMKDLFSSRVDLNESLHRLFADISPIVFRHVDSYFLRSHFLLGEERSSPVCLSVFCCPATDDVSLAEYQFLSVCFSLSRCLFAFTSRWWRRNTFNSGVVC